MRGVTLQGRKVRDTSYGARSRWRRATVAVAQGRGRGGAVAVVGENTKLHTFKQPLGPNSFFLNASH